MATMPILFDLDDTLVVEEASAEAAFLATCERAREQYGIAPKALYQAVRHHARQLWRASSTITYCRTIGISSWEGLWARFSGDDPNLKILHQWALTYRREAWARALADQDVHDLSFAEQLAALFPVERRARHVAFPEVETVLKDLIGNYRLALVTNGVPDLQHERIQGADLAQYFDAVIISGEMGVGKPDPRIFALALDKLAVCPGRAVMVGDSLARDIHGAQQADLKGIWINRSGVDCDEEITPDAQIASLSELRDVLQ
ncbi:MAG: HAD family hydrolase [Candidatus Latescibacteria bacterium]|nr:HAD family hydrolase [Candidatus Latescibacterota bacterium]